MTLEGRVVALSPHLDDAVFSVGAVLADAARRGAHVTVVTVFAGDPSSSATAGDWDARTGFATAGEAARARRDEDRAACARIGADCNWLPYDDEQYERSVTGDEIWSRLEPLLHGARNVLFAAHPLSNADHIWLTRLVLDRAGPDVPLVGYVEQPYALWSRRGWEKHALQPPWRAVGASPAAWLAKQRASRAYRSQLAAVAHPVQRLPLRIAMFELRRRGEWLAPFGTRSSPEADWELALPLRHEAE